MLLDHYTLASLCTLVYINDFNRSSHNALNRFAQKSPSRLVSPILKAVLFGIIHVLLVTCVKLRAKFQTKQNQGEQAYDVTFAYVTKREQTQESRDIIQMTFFEMP